MRSIDWLSQKLVGIIDWLMWDVQDAATDLSSSNAFENVADKSLHPIIELQIEKREKVTSQEL